MLKTVFLCFIAASFCSVLCDKEGGESEKDAAAAKFSISFMECKDKYNMTEEDFSNNKTFEEEKGKCFVDCFWRGLGFLEDDRFNDLETKKTLEQLASDEAEKEKLKKLYECLSSNLPKREAEEMKKRGEPLGKCEFAKIMLDQWSECGKSPLEKEMQEADKSSS